MNSETRYPAGAGPYATRWPFTPASLARASEVEVQRLPVADDMPATRFKRTTRQYTPWEVRKLKGTVPIRRRTPQQEIAEAILPTTPQPPEYPAQSRHPAVLKDDEELCG